MYRTNKNMIWNTKPLPFLLQPVGKDYLWGGNRLRDDYGKNIPLHQVAETWECSTHPEGPSTIASGPFQGQTLDNVLKQHPEYLGAHSATKGDLPILIKLIDAKQDLSVQVHPNDTYAHIHEHGQLGKTEMWYVLDAAKDSTLIYGLSKDVTPSQLSAALKQGTVMDYLQTVPIRKDDVFYIEAGTIHAIGAGSLIAEIQENSNVTYRLYDYNRVDHFGKKRPLHIEKTLQVSNLKSHSTPRQPMRVLQYRPGAASELLCRCKYFQVSRILINTERRQQVIYQADSLSFRVLLCVDGCGTLGFGDTWLNIYKGDCVFFPASSIASTLHGKMQFLDICG